MDILAICKTAKGLGIALTNAELGSDMCDAWIARVTLAQNLFEAGELGACADMIREANAYAI